MKKYLITGATGFIGSNLIKYLIYDGVKSCSIRLLIPPWENVSNLPNELFEVVIGDIRSRKDVNKATQSVDVVYHLAAKTVVKDGTYDYYKDTNLDGTVNVIDACVKNKVKKLIYFSSISVFGLPAWRGDMTNIDENSGKRYSEPYGRTKYESEMEILNACKKYKLNYIIIRPTTVFGPGDKAGIFQLFLAIRKGNYFFIGNARNKLDYVYVENLVKGARLAEKSKIVNDDFIIGGGKPTSQKHIANCIARSIGKNIPKFSIPKSFALTFSYIYVYFSKMLGLNPIIYPERVRVLTANCFFNSNKIKNILGFEPDYSFEEGIYKTAAFLKKVNYL